MQGSLLLLHLLVHKKWTYEKCDQSEWERTLFRRTPEEWTENRVMVIFGVRWRIGFQYHGFCICFPNKTIVLERKEGIGASWFCFGTDCPIFAGNERFDRGFLCPMAGGK